MQSVNKNTQENVSATFRGKEMAPARRESPEKRVFSHEEAFSLMEGRMSSPEAAFGIIPEYAPLITSEKELSERRSQGYDLVYFVPLTMAEQQELFEKRHSGAKGKLVNNPLSGEPFFSKDKPEEGWRFIKATVKGSTNKDYLAQIKLLADEASKEKVHSPKLKKTLATFEAQYANLKKLLTSNYTEFLKALKATGIEEELVPSMAELLFHNAAILAEKDERPLKNVYSRTSSRSTEYPDRVPFLGHLGAYGADVYRWYPDYRSDRLGVSSLRRLES